MVDKVDFPATNDYTFLESKAGDDWVFSGDTTTTITLNEENVSINNDSEVSIPQNGIIYVEDGDVEVSGILDGRLTIVSAGDTTGGNIKIVNNITYQNPDIEPSETASNDMLGLIAENDIVILDSAPDIVTVDAVMVAKNGSIGYEYWDGGGMGGGKSKGTITVNGSLIQKTDYGDVWTGKGGKHFGYTWGMSGSKAGYYKKLNYDERLHYSQPPYFFKPDRSLYEITWRQK